MFGPSGLTSGLVGVGFVGVLTLGGSAASVYKDLYLELEFRHVDLNNQELALFRL